MDHTVRPSCPLHSSVLWDLQAQWHAQQSEKYWTESSVPIFVTSNAYVASSYARLILSFLHDFYSSKASDESSEPVTILELGAGHGRLSFLVLRELWSLEDQWPEVPRTQQFKCVGAKGRRVPFQFVMTDVIEPCLDFWARHESLAPFVEAGVLEFGVLNAESRDGWKTELRPTGRKLSPGSLGAPVVVIANYLFNTLRQDLLRVTDGALQRADITLMSSHPQDFARNNGTEAPLDHNFLSRMRVEWSYNSFRCVTLAAFSSSPLGLTKIVYNSPIPHAVHLI